MHTVDGYRLHAVSANGMPLFSSYPLLNVLCIAGDEPTLPGFAGGNFVITGVWCSPICLADAEYHTLGYLFVLSSLCTRAGYWFGGSEHAG